MSMGYKDDDIGPAGGEGEDGHKILRMKGVRRKDSLRDPHKLGALIHLCITVLLMILLVYCLFPFFAAAERLGLSTQYRVALPVAVAALVVFFVRRAVGLVRTLRGEGS
jgi:hypothetical protein